MATTKKINAETTGAVATSRESPSDRVRRIRRRMQSVSALAGSPAPIRDMSEKLAQLFPHILVQSAFLGDFQDIERCFSSPLREPRLVIGPDVLADMARDPVLFTQIRKRVTLLLGANPDRRLLTIDGTSMYRSVVIQGRSFHLIEVHHDDKGDEPLAIADLHLDVDPDSVETPGTGFAGLGKRWRFRSQVRNRAAKYAFPFSFTDGAVDNDLGDDSDHFVALASRFLSFMEPLALGGDGGVSLRPVPGGVYFEINSVDGITGESERFMRIGGSAPCAATIWLSEVAG